MNDFNNIKRKIASDVKVARDFFTRYDKSAPELSQLNHLESKFTNICNDVKNNKPPYDLYSDPYLVAKQHLSKLATNVEKVSTMIFNETIDNTESDILETALNNCTKNNQVLSNEIKTYLEKIKNHEKLLGITQQQVAKINNQKQIIEKNIR
mgnify:CR=1 FL=1